MKVLHIISGGDSGGAKTHIVTLLQELNTLPELEIRLLCVLEGEFADAARNAGIDTTVIVQKKRYDIFSVRRIAAFIKAGGFEVVHFHGARANYIAMFLRLMGVRKRVFCTTIHSDYMLDFVNDPYKQRFYMPINKFALKRFNYFITISKAMARLFETRGFAGEKLFSVYNGIKTSAVPDEIAGQAEFLSEHGVKHEPDCIYIGIAARLHKVKGVDVFLKAAKLASARNKKLRFLIAGAGDLEAEFESFIADNGMADVCHMLGHVSDVFSFYNAVDINSLTSYSETFSYSLLEGGLMKKATIAADCGGIPEMIVNRKTGLLFKTGDHLELAECFLLLAGDGEMRRSCGEAFYQAVLNEFSAKRMGADHLKWYEYFIKNAVEKGVY